MSSVPFITQVLVPGVNGLDLHDEIDLVRSGALTRVSNVVRPEVGSLTGRPGQTSLVTFTGTGAVHSVGRLNNPATGGFTRIWGVGTNLYVGASGALATAADTGYSGSPLTLVPYHPPISNDTWMLVGDSAKNRKVRQSDGLVTQIGLPPGVSSPGDNGFHIDEFRIVVAPVPTLGAIDLIEFNTFGFTITATGPGVPGVFTAFAPLNQVLVPINTAIGNWTPNAGTGAGAPAVVFDTTVFQAGPWDTQIPPSSVKLTTKKSASGAYYNFWNMSGNFNLSTFTGVAATDDDLMHVFLRCDNPAKIAEIRLYFVVSGPFDANTLPGNDFSSLKNTDSYAYSFRPSDFTPAYTAAQTTLTASATANTNQQTGQQLSPSTDTRASTLLIRQQTEASRSRQGQLIQGHAQWTEFGVVGYPLHRRDFRRIGNVSANSWATVTGLVMYATTTDNTDAINIWVDGLYLQGGAGQDTSLPGLQPYNYRYTNYDPRTGAEGNPSPVQNIGFQLDSLRQGINVTPTKFGDANIRQRIYRQGGSLNNAWFFIGVNTSDGGTFSDIFSDLQIAASTQLLLDNDQPVTTVDAMGNTLLAQPLQSIWGPVSGIMFGCRDSGHRPGVVYWSKSLNADAWPSTQYVEACPPSEELMAGCVFAGQSFTVSRKQMYVLIPNVTATGQVTVLPTQNTHGLISIWGLVSGPQGMFQVDYDGIYQSAGAQGTNITDAQLRPLFFGQTVNGYLPIDFTHPEMIRLTLLSNELYFMYQDTGGTAQVLVYNLIFGYWLFHTFGRAIADVYGEITAPGQGTLLLGGRTTSKAYTFTGTTDDGLAITSSFRTPALDQGGPRETKLYGDMMVDANPNGVPITIQPYFDNETVVGTVQTIAAGATVRTRYYPDVPNYQLARNMTMDVSWTSTGAPPVFYRIGPSYTSQADTIALRVTNWDTQGRLSDKWVKGILMEFDTRGVAKQINLQGDNVTQQTITLPAVMTRTVQEFSFPEFLARELRLQPADTNQGIIYNFRWIFDEEPVSLSRFETQEVDHGVPTWQIPVFAHVTLNSTTTVNLTLTVYDQLGNPTVLAPAAIVSTGGLKQKRFVPLASTKGVLFKYLFTSSAPFRLYREESSVTVQPWGAEKSIVVKPFGTDDLDLTRTVHDAGLVAVRDSFGFSSQAAPSAPAGPNPGAK